MGLSLIFIISRLVIGTPGLGLLFINESGIPGLGLLFINESGIPGLGLLFINESGIYDDLLIKVNPGF